MSIQQTLVTSRRQPTHNKYFAIRRSFMRFFRRIIDIQSTSYQFLVIFIVVVGFKVSSLSTLSSSSPWWVEAEAGVEFFLLIQVSRRKTGGIFTARRVKRPWITLWGSRGWTKFTSRAWTFSSKKISCWYWLNFC